MEDILNKHHINEPIKLHFMNTIMDLATITPTSSLDRFVQKTDEELRQILQVKYRNEAVLRYAEEVQNGLHEERGISTEPPTRAHAGFLLNYMLRIDYFVNLIYLYLIKNLMYHLLNFEE